MTITVDCNNDTISFDGFDWKIKYPNQWIKILDELLNRLEPKNVSLEKIDEDCITTVGEW